MNYCMGLIFKSIQYPGLIDDVKDWLIWEAGRKS